jgi:hypothetical protein
MTKANPFDALANQTKPKKAKKKNKSRMPVWPDDFVGKPKSLGQILDEKLSQWHDEEYDAGKDW